MADQQHFPSCGGRRVVICDYNALLLSVTGLLRMSVFCVFQAHDGYAAEELCVLMPDIDLLIMNTYGTGIDVGVLCRKVRAAKPGIAVLHIGSSIPESLPADVPTLSEEFTAEGLLQAVEGLIDPASMTAGGSAGLQYGANAYEPV
jgi:hypothetical protein